MSKSGKFMPPVRNDIARERERRAWELRQRGFTHDRIAADLMVDRSSVSKMLKRVSQRVTKNLIEEATEEKIAQVEQLRYLVDDLFQAWDKSKANAKALTKHTSKPAGSSLRRGSKESEDVTIATKDQYGDTRYVDSAMRALAELRKILGIDAPERVDITSSGKPLVIKWTDIEGNE